MRRGLLVLLPVLVIGTVAGISAISARQADSAFIFYQEHPRVVQPRQFEVVLEKTREPVANGPGSVATAAHCVPGTKGPKRNPWRCTVRYESGHKIAYRLQVEPSGRFEGADSTGARTVNGCCIAGGAGASG
jgi:hypothetical protein